MTVSGMSLFSHGAQAWLRLYSRKENHMEEIINGLIVGAIIGLAILVILLFLSFLGVIG